MAVHGDEARICPRASLPLICIKWLLARQKEDGFSGGYGVIEKYEGWMETSGSSGPESGVEASSYLL